MSSQPFDETGYATLTGSRRSADVVLPVVFDLLGRPASVVDFGCGVGAWLAAARDLGVVDYLGLEGGHPEAGALQIDEDHLAQFDLERHVDLGRRFDLAISVEVGEHLPESLAGPFVASIARHADAVLFSAAIPGQHGTGHINERWPDYWADLFATEGLACFDPLRWALWADERVEWWYRQNLLLFARGPAADRLRAAGHTPDEPPAVIHPEMVEWLRMEPRQPARVVLTDAIKRRLPLGVRRGRPQP